ncbi:MAG: methyltransferase domain-containing protein [Candidatus Promineifilaceae bacterium]|nr:methyltransferase domain-containing protein [Candidatus Promineifilaceae bacterium]
MLDAAAAGGGTVLGSLDLGKTVCELQVTVSGVILPDGQQLPWSVVETIYDHKSACFHVVDGQAVKIQFFSQRLNRVYTLMPTRGAPTMLISGIPMHRIKGTDPGQDTASKIRGLSPMRGAVLDTATGLGYTAIAAAETAEEVMTIELDETVLEVCRLNPWSQELFRNPRLEQRIGDAFDEIEKMSDGRFDRVIHDPPTFSLAGHLYSGDFYRELYRVLKARGRLFHYIGDPDSPSGRSVTKGVMQRLREAGFRKVAIRRKAFGVLAAK